MVKDYVKKVQFVKNLTQEEIAESIGYSRSRISVEMKKDNPTIERLIVATYPDVFNDTKAEEHGFSYVSVRRKLKSEPKAEQIPIYDVPIDASFLERYRDDGPDFQPIGFLNIPKLRNCNFAAVISGNSMYPIMKSGTMAVCRMVDNLDYFDEGEMYFISTANGFETVKYVQSGDAPDELKLIPHNEKIKATTIKKSMVLRMCIVEAWLNFR